MSDPLMPREPPLTPPPVSPLGEGPSLDELIEEDVEEFDWTIPLPPPPSRLIECIYIRGTAPVPPDYPADFDDIDLDE